MGVEYMIFRDDNKTIFNLGKMPARWIDLDVAILTRPENEITAHLISLGVDGSSSYLYLLRDRLLDFANGASAESLKLVDDTSDYGWSDDQLQYQQTHDRYCTNAEIEAYSA